MSLPWIMSRDEYNRAQQVAAFHPAFTTPDGAKMPAGVYESVDTSYPLSTAEAIAECSVRGVACTEYKACRFARERALRLIGRGFGWGAADVDALVDWLADQDELTPVGRLRKRQYLESRGVPAYGAA